MEGKSTCYGSNRSTVQYNSQLKFTDQAFFHLYLFSITILANKDYH